MKFLLLLLLGGVATAQDRSQARSMVLSDNRGQRDAGRSAVPEPHPYFKN